MIDGTPPTGAPPARDEIGLALPEEVPALTELLARQLREHHVPVDEARLRGAIAAVVADDALGALVVARSGGTAVGVAFLSWIHSLEHQGPSAWLDEVFIDPPHRGRGLGRRLITAAIDHAHGSGRLAVELEVDGDHASIADLYRRMGFQRLPRERWQLTDPSDR